MNGSAAEDAPLQAPAAAPRGPRLLVACGAALSAAVAVALAAQIYSGDTQLVPHGGVASDAAACSGAGAAALRAGGRALDAAAVAALCLAVLAPHRTSLDASGALLYWEYRQARGRQPALAEWGLGGAAQAEGAPPRLLAALAELHARHGALPWARVLQPAIDLAKSGFEVSAGLAAAGGGLPGERRAAPDLARYLEGLQRSTSAELAAGWSNGSGLVVGSAALSAAGAWRVALGGPGAARVRRVLARALQPAPGGPPGAQRRVVAALQEEARAPGAPAWPPAPGAPATGLAVVDSFDTYVALVTGLSTPFGSGPGTPQGWRRDAAPEAAARLDLAPALLLDGSVCGTRYVLGGASGAALAQTAGALAAGAGVADAVEAPRAALLPGGALAPDAALAPGAGAEAPDAGAAPVNVVQQRADALLSHADSRGGGLASRF